MRLGARLCVVTMLALASWVTAAWGAPFAYVANSGSDSVSQFDRMGGPLAPLAPFTTATRGGPSGIIVSPDGRSAYVTELGEDKVAQYDVGPNGGLAPKSPPTVDTGTNPQGIAISPGGGYVYVTNVDSNTVSQFGVGLDGRLTALTPASVATGTSPLGVAVSPDGKSVYVTNVDGPRSHTVSQFDVGASGALSPKAPATVGAGNGPAGIAVSRSGESVYVANVAGTVSQYDVGTGGTLRAKTPASLPGGPGPSGLVVSPDGKSVYVTDEDGNRVSQFDANSEGKLSPKTPKAVPSGKQPKGIAIAPDGNSVYVTDGDSTAVSQYRVGAKGRLVARIPATVRVGRLPAGIAVGPGSGPQLPPGIVLARPVARISQGAARLVLTCPQGTAGCSGTLALKTRQRLVLGRVSIVLAAGTTRSMSARLTTAGRRLLTDGRHRRTRVVASFGRTERNVTLISPSGPRPVKYGEYIHGFFGGDTAIVSRTGRTFTTFDITTRCTAVASPAHRVRIRANGTFSYHGKVARQPGERLSLRGRFTSQVDFTLTYTISGRTLGTTRPCRERRKLIYRLVTTGRTSSANTASVLLTFSLQ